LVFGPRYSTFNGNFKYVGGNEDFDIKSKQWGVEGDIENQEHILQFKWIRMGSISAFNVL
jgi:hypothetical protein